VFSGRPKNAKYNITDQSESILSWKQRPLTQSYKQ
jgi:hypothetical protein